MRFRIAVVFLLLVAAVVAGISHAQQPTAQAAMASGLWEVTVQTRSPIAGAPLTHTVCIDKALALRPDPPRSRPSDDCQVQPDAAASNETAYTVRCTKRGVTSSFRFTYWGDHFDGSSTITSSEGHVQQTFSGKRVGACDNTPTTPAVTSTGN